MKAFPLSKRIMNRTAAVSNALRMKSEDERSSNFLSTIYWFNTYERTSKARHPELLFCTPRLNDTYCFHYLNGLVLFDETKTFTMTWRSMRFVATFTFHYKLVSFFVVVSLCLYTIVFWILMHSIAILFERLSQMLFFVLYT